MAPVEEDLPHANIPPYESNRPTPGPCFFFIYVTRRVRDTHTIIGARFSTCAPLVVVAAAGVRSHETPPTTTDVFISSLSFCRFSPSTGRGFVRTRFTIYVACFPVPQRICQTDILRGLLQPAADPWTEGRDFDD